MMRPGDRLRRFAARSCSDDTMSRLIDPLIADLQAEHAHALRRGRMWRSRWVRLAGYIAFVKVFAVCEWSPIDDTRPLIRVLAFSLGAAALATAALVAIPYGGWMQGGSLAPEPWRVVVTLLPQALVLSVPIGLMIGIAIALAGQTISGRLATAIGAMALVCSISAIPSMGWLVPNANQAFRTTVSRMFSPTPPAKGENELTFAELDRLIARRRALPGGSDEWDNVDRLRTVYHTRWALAFAACVSAMFSMSLVACTRQRWKIVAGVVAALFGYSVLLDVGRSFGFNRDLAPPAAAWLPNAVLVLISAALQTSRVEKSMGDASSRPPASG